MNNSARGIPSGGDAFKDPKQREWALDMQENVEILLGTRGDPLDQALTWRKDTLLGRTFLKDGDLVKDISEQPDFAAQQVQTPGWNGVFAIVNETALRTDEINVMNGEALSWAGAFAAVNEVTKQTDTITVSGGLFSPDGVYTVVNPLPPRTTLTMTIVSGRIVTVI